VTNEGSWLEIGLSLSRFFIAIVTTLVLLIFYVIAGFIMSSNLYETIQYKLITR